MTFVLTLEYIELGPHHLLLPLLQKFCCTKGCCQNIQISLFQVREDFPSFLLVLKRGWFQFLHIFANTFYFLLFFFDISHSNGCEVVSFYHFDLHFPND